MSITIKEREHVYDILRNFIHMNDMYMACKWPSGISGDKFIYQVFDIIGNNRRVIAKGIIIWSEVEDVSVLVKSCIGYIHRQIFRYGPHNVSDGFDLLQQYRLNDLTIAKEIANSIYGIPGVKVPKIKDVIFNNPATIVFWTDGTKTVVKCDKCETYDREKGLAMAISRKALGNKGNYYNEFEKWFEEDDKRNESSEEFQNVLDQLLKAMNGKGDKK